MGGSRKRLGNTVGAFFRTKSVISISVGFISVFQRYSPHQKGILVRKIIEGFVRGFAYSNRKYGILCEKEKVVQTVGKGISRNDCGKDNGRYGKFSKKTRGIHSTFHGDKNKQQPVIIKSVQHRISTRRKEQNDGQGNADNFGHTGGMKQD